jgi:hypothetical protein
MMGIYNLYSSSNWHIVRMIERGRIKEADHVACLEGMKNSYKPLDVQSESKSHKGYLGRDRRIILKCIVERTPVARQ